MSATYCPGAVSFSPEESAVNSHAMCTWDSSRPTFQPLIASILFLNLCSSLSPGLLQVQNTTCSHVPAEATLRGAAGRSATHATLTHLNVSFKEKKKKKKSSSFSILLSLQALAFSVSPRLAGSPSRTRPQAHSCKSSLGGWRAQMLCRSSQQAGCCVVARFLKHFVSRDSLCEETRTSK